MQFVLIVVAIAAAILFDIRPSGAYQGPWCAGTSRGERVICVQLQHANLRTVRLRGDRRQPRVLQPEPILPRARGRSAQGQAKAILLLTITACRRRHKREHA